MTGMTGIDLATKLSLERPQLKVLIVSGFSAELLVLNNGWHFLSKPFIPSQLCSLVAGLVSLDREARFSEVPAREGEI
jgi:YesN/AraC family two-component response regulator